MSGSQSWRIMIAPNMQSDRCTCFSGAVPSIRHHPLAPQESSPAMPYVRSADVRGLCASKRCNCPEEPASEFPIPTRSNEKEY